MKKLKRSKTSLISAVVFASVLVLFSLQPVQATTQTITDSFYTPNGTYAIPDGVFEDQSQNYQVLTLPIEITENYTITHLGVEVNITHPYDDDLTISLVAPDGREFTLARHNGESGDNFTNTMFDDDAQFSIIEGTAPFTGFYKPVDSLTDLSSTKTAGTWTLKVLDDATEDVGTLNNFGLIFTYADVDEDQDGYTITSDCNDNDASINPGVLDNTQDSVDNNCNGQIDEDYKVPADTNTNTGNTNTNSGNTNTNGDTTTNTPPADTSTNTDTNTNTDNSPEDTNADNVDVTTEDQTPETSDTDTQITEVAVVKVSPTKKGYKITYSDGSVKTVVVFKTKSQKKTKVKYYPKKDLVLVLQGNGKKIALWNVLTNQKVSQAKLSSKAYNTNSFKIKKIDDKKTVIIKSLNKKQQESQKSLVRLLLKKQNLKTVSTILGE